MTSTTDQNIAKAGLSTTRHEASTASAKTARGAVTREWFTAQEIADQHLPGLPTTKRRVNAIAEREAWASDPALARRREGRGGGMEYHISVLPTLAQVTLQHRNLSVEPAPEAERETILSSENLSERAQIERDARLAIVHAFDRYAAGLRQCSRTAQLQLFCDNYAAGRIAVDNWIKAVVPSFSKRSLSRWRASVRKGDFNALATDKAEARKGTGILDTAEGGKVRSFILALIAQQPHISAEKVRMLTRNEFGPVVTDGKGRECELPPVRTFQRTMKQLKTTEKVVLTRLSNPDKYRSTMAPSGVGALRHVTRPNALWQIDASPLDAMDTGMSRPTIYACIDIATRRLVIYVTRTPRAQAVALLIRKALAEWGVPDVIMTDNGSDFVAEASKRLLDALGIDMHLSAPYHPQQKGHVERAIGTMQHHFAEMLPGYVGHSVTDRKAIEDRKSFAARLGAETADLFGVSLTMQEIQELADRWVETYYLNHPHAGLGGKTPAEAAAENPAVVRKVDERALDILLMPVAGKDGFRTVTKFGVKVDGFSYATFKALPGDRVFVRMDPNDLGLAYVFDADTKAYIEHAICPERAGIDPAKFMRAVKSFRSEYERDRSADIKRELKRLTSGPAMIERYLEEMAKDLPPRENVVRLPQRHVGHETEDIAGAMEAATGERPEPTESRPTTDAEPSAEIVAFKPKTDAAGRPAFRTDHDMAAWLLEHPEQVTDNDRALMRDRLGNWTFKQLLIGRGIDPESVAALTKTTPKEEANR